MKRMKRFLATMLALTLVLSVTACGGEKEQESAQGDTQQEQSTSEEKIVLKLADTQPESSLLVQVEKMFGDALAEATDGRITVEIYPASQLGNATTYTQMVQAGDVAIARNDASAVYDFGVESHKILSLPYLFKDSKSALDLLNGEVGDQLKQDTADADLGFIDLGWVVDSNRCFFTHNREVNTLEDLRA